MPQIKKEIQKMKHLKKRVPALLIALIICSSFTVPALAADKAFSFNQGNTGQTYITYTSTYNTKVYSGNPATVKVSTNTAEGYGFAFRMHYKNSNGTYSKLMTPHTAKPAPRAITRVLSVPIALAKKSIMCDLSGTLSCPFF